MENQKISGEDKTVKYTKTDQISSGDLVTSRLAGHAFAV